MQRPHVYGTICSEIIPEDCSSHFWFDLKPWYLISVHIASKDIAPFPSLRPCNFWKSGCTPVAIYKEVNKEGSCAIARYVDRRDIGRKPVVMRFNKPSVEIPEEC
jgi:hypothetical protein